MPTKYCILFLTKTILTYLPPNITVFLDSVEQVNCQTLNVYQFYTYLLHPSCNKTFAHKIGNRVLYLNLYFLYSPMTFKRLKSGAALSYTRCTSAVLKAISQQAFQSQVLVRVTLGKIKLRSQKIQKSWKLVFRKNKWDRYSIAVSGRAEKIILVGGVFLSHCGGRVKCASWNPQRLCTHFQTKLWEFSNQMCPT